MSLLLLDSYADARLALPGRRHALLAETLEQTDETHLFRWRLSGRGRHLRPFRP